MKIPSIPEKLEDWSIDVINELIKINRIEGESFDFKGDINSDSKLYEDICAMANSNGGYLVLGIEENKTSDGTLLGFEKKGFEIGQEDKINSSISNYFHKVEPNPKMTFDHIIEGKKFYPIIKIMVEEFKKPFFVKDSWQCFIRVGNSSRRASRSIILSLMQRHVASSEEKRNHTNYLKPILEQLSAAAIIADREFKLRLKVPNNYDNYRMGIFTIVNSEIAQKYPWDYVNIQDVRHMHWVLSHLVSDEYSEINQSFDKMTELLEMYNESVSFIFRYLEQQLRTLMEQYFFNFLLDSPNTYGNNERSVNIDKLIKFLLETIKISQLSAKPIDFNELKKSHSVYQGGWHIAGEYTQSLMKAPTEEELDMGKLIEILTTAYNKGVELGIFDKLKTEKDMQTIIKQIKKNLESLVIDLEGGELIKGYCKLGY